MSTTDNRIVKMQFDNAQFEAGVAKSMQTLDNLNAKLESLSGFADGATTMIKGIGSGMLTGLKGISAGVEKIEQYTTTIFGKIANKFKTEVADKIYDSLTSIPTKALGQIKSGGWNRAMNIANAQFQIEGLKYSWDEVKKAADYAVTGTAYGFDEAAKAASQLAASGVDFEKIIGKDGAGNDVTQMHKSLRAISGLAAMTNSSFDDIAHIFTRIAGTGKVMTEDLNMIAGRGINAAASIAEQLGTTEAAIREMVHSGEMDFQTFAAAMDDAFGEHAMEANKTFQGSLSNMKAALSRIGAIFTQPVIDKTNTFFVAVTDRIKEFQKALNDSKGYNVTEKGMEKIRKKAEATVKQLKGVSDKDYAAALSKEINRLKDLSLGDQLTESLKAGDVEEHSIIGFAGHFAEAWESAVNAASKIVSSLDLSWFTDIASFLDRIAQKAKNFFDNVSKYIDETKNGIEKTVNGITEAAGFSLADFRIIERVMSGELGFMEYRWNKIDEIMKQEGEGKRIQGWIDKLAQVGYSYEKMGWTEEWIKEQEELATMSAEDHEAAITALVQAKKDEVATTMQEASAEEILYTTVSRIVQNLSEAIQEAKRIVGGIVKIIGNVATGIGRIFGYLGQIGKSLHLADILRPIADIIDALVEFTDKVGVPVKMLQALGDNVSIFGQKIKDAFSAFGEVTSEAIKFAAACITSEESLDDLAENESLTKMQKNVLNVLIAVRNAFTGIKNIIVATIKLIKSIAKAFANVFDASSVLGGISGLSGGFAALTEQLIISDEVAEDIEKVFTKVFTVIGTVAEKVFKAIGAFGKFIKDLFKTDDAAETFESTTRSLSKASEEAGNKFEGLKKKLSEFYDKIKSIPDKVRELKDALSQQEGIKKLKETLSSVGTILKEKIESILPSVKTGVTEMTRTMDGKGQTAIGAFADGLGKLAEKISNFIDKIPDAIKKVETFFDNLKKKIEEVADKFHVGEFFDGIGKAFNISRTTEGSIWERIKAFIEGLYGKIEELINKIDWKKIARIGFIGVIFGNLVKILSISNEIKKLITNVASIPKTISGVINSVGGLLTQASTSLKKFTNVYVIVSLISALASLVAGVVVLANMDQEDLKDGLAALVVIAAVILLLSKGFEHATNNLALMSRSVPKTISEVNNSKQGVIELTNNIGGSFGLAAVIGSLAAAFFVLFKGVIDVINVVKSSTADQLRNAFKLILTVLIAVGTFVVIVGIFVAVCKKIHIGKNESKTVTGLAFAIAAFGVAVWLIAQAVSSLADISDADALSRAYKVIIRFMIAIGVFAFAIAKAVKGVNIKAFIGLAIVMVVLGGLMWSILAEIMVLATAMTPSESYVKAVWQAFGVLAGMLLALGAYVFLLGKGLAKIEKPGPMIAVIASMAAIVLFIGIAVSMMAKQMRKNDAATNIAVILGMIAIVGIISIGVSNMIKQLNSQKSFLGSDGATKVLMLAVVIAAMGVTMLLIAESAKSFAEAGVGGVIAAIAFLVLIGGGILLLIKQISKLNGAQVSETLVSLAIAFIAIGVSLYIVAAAAEKMQSVNPLVLLGLGAALVVLIGAFILIGVLMTTKIGPGIEKATTVFMSFSISVLILCAGVFLLGVGIGALGTGCAKLALGLAVLGEAISEHKLVFIFLLVVIAAIIIIIWKLAPTINGIVTVVTTAVTTVITAIKTLIETVSTLLNGVPARLSGWWKNLGTNTKLAIASVAAGAVAGIAAATPEMLGSIKEVIKKVVFFIIDIIPTVVDALFAILLRIVNSLADTIRKNSAQLAYAFWNIIEALLEVLTDVLFQGITLLLKGIEKVVRIFKSDFSFDDFIEEMNTSANSFKAGLREGMAVNQEYADSTEMMTQAFSGLDASMGKVTKGLVKNGKAITNAEGKLVSLSDVTSGFSISAKSLVGNGAGMNALTNFISSDTFGNLGAGYFKTGEDAGGEAGEGFIDGMVSKFTGGDASSLMSGMGDMGGIDAGALMDQAGLGGDAFNMEGMMSGEAWGEGMGESYDNAAAQEIASSDNREQIYDATTDVIVDETERAMKDAEPQIRESTTKHVTTSVTTAITSGFPQIFASAGQIIPGIIGVLEAGKPMLETKAAELGDIMDKGFRSKDGIDSNSPSKKFYNSGLWCVLGVANAIDENTGKASGAMLNLSDQMIAAFGNPLEYAARMASGEIEYDPSIRPILDTSMVGVGANSINSMFDNQNVSLSGLAGTIAYDMTNLNGSNAAVVAEIQGLREDMDYMTQQMTNMQIVMDTGALVGATAGAMDKDLGMRKLYSERGDI